MPEVALILFGIIIATLAMAIGIGGGILWTPLLILIYGLSPTEAISTSLFIQTIGLGSGTVAYLKQGRVKHKLALALFVIALPGIILGSLFTLNMSQNAIQMALGSMALILAMLFVSIRQEDSHASVYTFSLANVRKVAIIPAFFGIMMGSLSSGISEWLIPALRSKLRLSMPYAIGTAIAMMFMAAIVASLVHLALSDSDSLHPKLVLLGGFGTIIGGQIGVHISQKINDRLLQQGFIYLMTLIGIHLIFQAI